MSIFYIKRGDTSPSLLYRVSANLAGATAVFNLRGVLSRQPATIQDDTLRYDWDATDTSAPGIYEAEFEVTYADGSVETFPNNSFITVKITGDIA